MVRVRPTGVRRGSHTRFLGRGTQMDAPDTVLRGQNSTAGGRPCTWPLKSARRTGNSRWVMVSARPRSAATLKLSVAPCAGNNDFELLLDIAELLSKRAVFVRYETHSTQV